MCGARAFIPSMPVPIAPINLFREPLFKCSPDAPPSSTDTALTIGLPEHTSRSPPPSTSTNALHHPTSAPYLHPHQHSRSNPTHIPLLSVVPLPSPRTIQIQHTTAPQFAHRRSRSRGPPTGR